MPLGWIGHRRPRRLWARLMYIWVNDDFRFHRRPRYVLFWLIWFRSLPFGIDAAVRLDAVTPKGTPDHGLYLDRHRHTFALRLTTL